MDKKRGQSVRAYWPRVPMIWRDFSMRISKQLRCAFVFFLESFKLNVHTNARLVSNLNISAWNLSAVVIIISNTVRNTRTFSLPLCSHIYLDDFFLYHYYSRVTYGHLEIYTFHTSYFYSISLHLYLNIWTQRLCEWKPMHTQLFILRANGFCFALFCFGSFYYFVGFSSFALGVRLVLASFCRPDVK